MRDVAEPEPEPVQTEPAPEPEPGEARTTAAGRTVSDDTPAPRPPRSQVGVTLPDPVTIDARDARRTRSLRGYIGHLGWLWAHRTLIRKMAQVQLRLTVAQSRLYYLWWLLDPLLETLCYALLFLVIGRGQSDGSAPLIAFLLTAMIPWKLTSACLDHATGVWGANRGLLDQIRFPSLVLLMARALSELWLYAVALGVLVISNTIAGVRPTWTLLLLPGWVAIHALMALALMPLMAIGTAYSQDLRKLIPYGTRLLFFASPILYPVSALPDALEPYAYANPLTMLTEGYRNILLEGTAPDPGATTIFVGALLLLLLLSSYLFIRLERSMIRSVGRIY